MEESAVRKQMDQEEDERFGTISKINEGKSETDEKARKKF